MADLKSRHSILLWFSLAGLFVSTLAGLADHWLWLQMLCGSFAGSCRAAAEFTLFGLPLWAWGIAYYLLLAVSIYRFPAWISWLVSSAIGFEAALVWIAVSSDLYCTFCLANLLIVLLLAIFSFDRQRLWQIAAVSSLFFLLSILLVPKQNVFSAFSTVKQDQPEAVARVGGAVITEQELQTPIAARIYDLEKQIYQMKRQRLERMIDEKVIDMEAARNNISAKQLIDEAVLSKGVSVSDEEVNRYLVENRNRLQNWQGSMEDLRGRVKSYLENRKSQEKVTEYAKSLRERYNVSVYLEEPRLPHVEVDVKGSPALGPADAPVTVVEFSDYQCPVCRQSHEVVRKIREAFGERIQWIFKDYPLKMHKYAQKAAEAARCAADQGKFWEYQDALFGADGDLTPHRLQGYAAGLHLDTGRFAQCLAQGTFQKAVEQDILEGKRIGVNATPSFLINGRLITGFIELNRFKTLIEQELNRVEPGAHVSTGE